jgi:hypothetical protein
MSLETEVNTMTGASFVLHLEALVLKTSDTRMLLIELKQADPLGKGRTYWLLRASLIRDDSRLLTGYLKIPM